MALELIKPSLKESITDAAMQCLAKNSTQSRSRLLGPDSCFLHPLVALGGHEVW
jgi:hypothetical protein